MKKLTLADFRVILEHLPVDEEVLLLSDEDLLSADLKEDLLIDSLDMLVLALEVENYTGISLPDNQNYGTVQDFIDACNTLLINR